MSITLEHLPDEMLAYVVEQMPGASRKVFSLVSRRMRAVTVREHSLLASPALGLRLNEPLLPAAHSVPHLALPRPR